MDDYTAVCEVVDEIKGSALALLKQAERLARDNPGQINSLQAAITILEYTPSAHGDDRKVFYEPIPEG